MELRISLREFWIQMGPLPRLEMVCCSFVSLIEWRVLHLVVPCSIVARWGRSAVKAFGWLCGLMDRVARFLWRNSWSRNAAGSLEYEASCRLMLVESMEATGSPSEPHWAHKKLCYNFESLFLAYLLSSPPLIVLLSNPNDRIDACLKCGVLEH